jgi:NAD(P)-dependent dehydrogenase (short-subunit alcohol dehydrogenase family)
MLGRIYIPAMIRDGYSRGFSVVATAASSVVAPIIPPSIGSSSTSSSRSSRSSGCSSPPSFRGSCSYYASNAAVTNFTAIEYAARGIRANTIMPGITDTPHICQQVSGYHADVEEMRVKRAAIPPMKRQGDAWDIAMAFVFLASDEARYITGIALCVDGGLHCRST